jgi:ABC-2 type transport system ATP-binding protein
VQFLADRVVIIAAGKIVAEGTPDSLMGRKQADTLIRFRLERKTIELPDGLRAMSRINGESIELETKEATRTLHVLTSWAVEKGVELDGLQVTRPSLEDVYLEITREAAPA